MTVLLYDYRELQEGPPRNLNTWKACHLILYVFAAVFGLANYAFLRKAMDLVDENCILNPRELEFHTITLPEAQTTQEFNEKNITDAQYVDNLTVNKEDRVKRDDVEPTKANEESMFEANMTAGNETHRLVLDLSRTLFQSDNCVYAEYMPILSTVCALVWITLFTMCPSGGHSRTGLTEPWRILGPALLFALVMVGLMGRSFTVTNTGIQAFCQSFYNVTNSTTCSSVDPYLEASWNASWGMGGRTGAARAASAGAWAAWACAAALLMARCLAAPDFVVKRTTVYLARDPQQKILPHLKKSPKKTRNNGNSHARADNISIRSEPTMTTEVVTASVEQGDSAPTSLMVTPVKGTTTPRNMESIELTHSPQELLEQNHNV